MHFHIDQINLLSHIFCQSLAQIFRYKSVSDSKYERVSKFDSLSQGPNGIYWENNFVCYQSYIRVNGNS